MLRFLRLVLMLYAGLALAVSVTAAQPASHAAAEFLGAEDCPLPCWHRIQPGITPTVAALSLLKSDPWVNLPDPTAIEERANFYDWQWSGLYPFTTTVGSAHLFVPDGIMSVTRREGEISRVASLSMNAGLALADMWLLLGPPTSFTVGSLRENGEVILIVTLYQMGGPGMSVTAFQSCPLNRDSLWRSRVTIQMNASRFPMPTGNVIVRNTVTLIKMLADENRRYCGR
jgi:hypothetical protein